MSNACGAPGLLSAAHLDALAELLAGNARALRAALDEGPELRCALERHSGPHMDLVHDSGSGTALWAQWPGPGGDDGSRDGWLETVVALPDCPATTPGRGTGCWAYLAHPGAHTWELTPPWAVGRSPVRQP
ncbi:hypothetical protein ACFXPI_28355 [Streptomyces sp. NPDC059104]|uniref:hypothetical protein n=1 Tax=Streptomyces sp. NPDC059104 TaxID=3346729 RepID=UPI0036A42E15